MDLEKDPGVVLQCMDGLGEPFEPFDVPVGGDAELPDVPLPSG